MEPRSGTATVYVGDETLSSSAGSPAYATTDESGKVITEGATADSYNIKWDGSTLTLKDAYITEAVSTSDYSNPVEGAAIGVFNQNGNAALTIQLEGSNIIEDVRTGIYVLSSNTGTGDASLTITGENGGSLDARGSGAGIRVVSISGAASLTIENAVVEAAASSVGNGVLVQSGESASASLAVEGGSLTATGKGNSGAGIRFRFGTSGSGSGTSSLTVSGNAVVRANGGIVSNSSTPTQIEAGSGNNGGIVWDGNEGTVYGNVTLQEDITIGEGESLTIPGGVTLTIPAGVTLTVEGEIINNGTIICNGAIIGVEKITGPGTIKYPEPEPEPTPEEPEEEETYIPSAPIADGVHEYSLGKMLYIDGKRAKGLTEYEGAAYYFDQSGWMQTGWVQLEDGWRYFDEDGKMATGWLQIGNAWYYLDPETGLMLDDGLHTIGKSTYYFHGWGGMASDWWYQDGNGDWYYFGGSGAMKAACWVEWKGDWYYLTETGKMAVNTDIGGYYVNADGVWVG